MTFVLREFPVFFSTVSETTLQIYNILRLKNFLVFSWKSLKIIKNFKAFLEGVYSFFSSAKWP